MESVKTLADIITVIPAPAEVPTPAAMGLPEVSAVGLLEHLIAYDVNGADAPESISLTGGTPYSNGYYGSDTPGNAVDADTGTYWRPTNSSTPPFWWGFDFGEGQTRTIRQLKIYVGSYSIRNFIFQGSNNDSDWDDLYVGLTVNSAGWMTFGFINSTAYRYYRIYCTTTGWSSSVCCLHEVEMAESLASYSTGLWYKDGSLVTVLGNDSFGLVKAGYTFEGWNTQADGGGTDYAPEGTFNISENLTLYAKWVVEA
jgi:uncharacterized repeat protein (TIGR02543 family)